MTDYSLLFKVPPPTVTNIRMHTILLFSCYQHVLSQPTGHTMWLNVIIQQCQYLYFLKFLGGEGQREREAEDTKQALC